MTAKEYLESINNLKLQIKFDLSELAYWKELSTTISGCNFEEKYNPNNGSEAPFVKCVIKIKELEDKINKERVEAEEKKYRILNYICLINNIDYRNILVLRYLKHMTWSQISEEMSYSQRWIYKLHIKALSEFEKIIENKTP